MDLSTLAGILIGSFFIIAAILTGGPNGGVDPNQIWIFINLPSILIVIGGTIATMFIRYSFKETFGSFKIVKHTLFRQLPDAGETIREFIQLAQIARKDGLLALERVTIADPFMAKGIAYCVDGAETEQIKNILSKEIAFTKGRHEAGQDLLGALETSAPAFGMIGTLIGLVNMLANMEDPKSIGPAMAVAILTTLYGAIIANLFALPLKDKLAIYSGDELHIRGMMLEGILALNKGENPRMLQEALNSYLSPTEREALQMKA